AERAVSPHPELVRALCTRLLDLGAVVRIGDSPAFGTARGVARATGILDVAKGLGVPVVELRNPGQVITAGPKPLRLQIDREVLDSDAVINLCKLKNHQQMGMTGAVKNLFGCITGKRKPVWHLRLGDHRNDFAEMLIEVYRNIGPVVSICDGILAMEGNGPGEGDPRSLGILLAAEDGVAMDVVSAQVVGHPLDELRILGAARDLQVGCWNPDNIDVVGDCTVDAVQVHDWRPADPLPIFFNPARVAWSTAKQVGLMARMRLAPGANKGPKASAGA
ncbi:MAG TPA: hypothetical protein DIU15_16060, partial [Deltaproteobacteria bacterium]|nr:hypothetical protein [Deltaproteobacteria bacterium]